MIKTGRVEGKETGTLEFVFCHNRDQGEMVLKLLQGEGV